MTDVSQVVDLLEELVSVHDALGTPLRRSLRPPCQPRDLVSALPDGDFALHSSVGATYLWHDGIDWSNWRGSGTPSFFPYFGELHSFRRQVEHQLIMSDTIAGLDDVPMWRPSWFRIFGGQNSLVVECEPGARTRGSVWFSSLDEMTSSSVAGALSLLLERVIELFAEGRFTYGPNGLTTSPDVDSATVIGWLSESSI